MKVKCIAAGALLVAITITCLFPQKTLSALKPKPKEQIQAKTKAKEVRIGVAVAQRAERLKQTSQAFSQAVKDLEDRGLRPKYDDGLSLFYAKPKQQLNHARPQNIAPVEGDPPPDTEEISYFSFDSPAEKWVGVVYSTIGGVNSTQSGELLITDQINEILSLTLYDYYGSVIGQYYNADYYDLSPWGYSSQPSDYYDQLAKVGLCVSDCSVYTLFQQPSPNPRPTPMPSPGPKTPVPSPSPGLPGPRPTPGPAPIGGGQLSPFDRCVLGNCVLAGFGCAFTGPKWPLCFVVGCGVVVPIACKIQNP